MEIYFVKLRIGYPDTLQPLDSSIYVYTLYGICHSKNGKDCTLYKDLLLLKHSKRDMSSTRQGLTNLFHKATNGMNIREQYDEKELHDAFSFKLNNKKYTILRIRESSIRFYFMHLSHRKIVILKILSKRTDNLTKAQKNEIQNLANSVLDYSEHEAFLKRILP